MPRREPRLMLISAAGLLACVASAASLAESDGAVHTDPAGRVTTGAHSRAELHGDNGALVRLGSHADATVNAAGDTVTVERGSVLVTAPAGASVVVKSGAGEITLPAGATALVTVDAAGAAKIRVLAGAATLADGAKLQAGRMAFVDSAGKTGETPDFDLARLVTTSRLVKGFATPLPALDAIRAASVGQNKTVAAGDLRRTGLALLNAEHGDGLRVAPAQVLTAAINARAALDIRNLQPVALQSPTSPNLTILVGANLPGGSALVDTDTGTTLATAAGSNSAGSTTLSAGTLSVGTGGNTDATVANAGTLKLGGTGGGGTLAGSGIISGAGTLTLGGAINTFDGNNGTLLVSYGDYTLASTATDTYTIKNSTIVTLSALQSVKFGNAALTTLSVDGVSFQVPATASVAMNAKTLNLQNINFSAGSVVTLRSQNGVLNIGDSQVGAVNFITNVKYDGADLTTVGGINTHVNAPLGVTQNGAPLAGATGNAAGSVSIGKLPN